MRRRRTRLQIQRIDQLRKGGRPLAPVIQHHIHHLVVTGIAQGLGIGTVHERRAEYERVDVALQSGLVKRHLLVTQFMGGLFQGGQQWLCMGPNGIEHVVKAGIIQRRGANGAGVGRRQVDLFQPAAGLTQEHAQARRHQLIVPV